MARKGEDNRYGDGVAWIRGSMIGKGSFGRVYIATLRNPTSPNPFFPPLMAVKSAEFSSSNSIQDESQVYRNIGECPYKIDCYGEETTFGQNGTTMAYNLMLEYASGGTLADRIEESGGKGLAELEARLHTRSILRGLRHIHDHGYVHCDLKPGNILLVDRINGGLRAKIGDLGLAKKVWSQSRKRKLGFRWEGTALYLSPEAVMINVQETPSDVWAIGCIVFEMLTGKSPLEEVMMKKELEAVEILKQIGEGRGRIEIPKELSNEAKLFLEACFATNPKFRLSCDMLLLHPFLDGLDDDDDDEGLEIESDHDESSSSSFVDGSISRDDEDDDCFSSCSDNEEEYLSSSSRRSDESESDINEEKAAKRVRMVDAVRMEENQYCCPLSPTNLNGESHLFQFLL